MTIRGINIADDVLTTKFACDYLACKGWCCHGGNPSEYDGPTVTAEEAYELIDNAEKLASFVEEDSKELAKEPVYHYEDKEDEHFIQLTPAGKCIYCSFKEESCVLKLHDTGLSFPLPEHCGLYPFKVTTEGGVTTLRLQFDYGDICKPAFVKGERDNMHVVKFGRDSLIRKFGVKFYKELEAHLK